MLSADWSGELARAHNGVLFLREVASIDPQELKAILDASGSQP